jgi:anti-sigma factor RsiW
MRHRHRTSPPDLTCAEVVELITDYLEGALAPDMSARVSEHLAACEGCTVYLDQMRATSKTLRGVELAGLSEEACDTLLSAFRDWGRN